MAKYLSDKAKFIMHVTVQHSINNIYKLCHKHKKLSRGLYKDKSRIRRSDVKNN